MNSMRLTAAFATALIAGACLFTIACGGDGGAEGNEETPDVSAVAVTSTSSVTPRARRTPTPSPSPTATPLEVCSANPDPADRKVLQVEQPLPNAQVRLPVHVRGWGSTIGVNNAGVFLGVVNQKQDVVQVNKLPPLSRDFRVAPQGLEITDSTRPFAADIVLNNVTEPTPYCLWIYLTTNEQGKAQQVVQVPVVILPR